MTKKERPNYVKAYDAWSTVYITDPIAIPLVPFPAALRINPTAITIFSLLLGIISAVLFGLGYWIWAAVMFETSFLADCLDGKVAKFRQMTSEFGTKLDVLVDSIHKPSCLLGIATFFYFNEEILFAILTVILVAVYKVIHSLYGFLGVFHCDPEFPNFHRKIVRRFAPRIVALYTYFDEQLIMFVIVPLIVAFVGLPQAAVFFLWGSLFAISLGLLKLIIVYNYRRKGTYEQVRQDYAYIVGYQNEPQSHNKRTSDK